MAFTLSDSRMHLGRDTMSEGPSMSDVKDILFESAINMPTFVRRSSVNLSTLVASPVPNLDAIEEIDDEELEEGEVLEQELFDDEEEEEEEEEEDESVEEAREYHPPTETSPERIKVFLRIRPTPNSSPNFKFDPSDSKILWVENLKANQRSTRKPEFNYFKFNQIFDNNTEQWPIFQDCALPLLRDFITGENSLLFTYGITSSGKSHTMRGTNEKPGVIPISLVLLFAALESYMPNEVPKYKPAEFCSCRPLSAQEQEQENANRLRIIDENGDEIPPFIEFASATLKEKTRIKSDLLHAFESDIPADHKSQIHCGIWISYYEIYNEKVYDLLDHQVDSKNRRRQSKVSMQTNGQNQMYINGLKQIYVTSAIEAYHVYLYGQEKLKNHISATALNTGSSRSHSSFSMSLVRVDEAAQQAIISNISFCDLAGVERIKKTLATGAQKDEANKINKSLTFLGQCLLSLKTQQNGTNATVSYRQSKLTQVFQPYLSGSGGRTYIIYNLNPQVELFDESYYSLDFCTIAKEIKQNQVRPKQVRKLSVQPAPVEERSFIDDDVIQNILANMHNLSAFVERDTDDGEGDYAEERRELQEKIASLQNLVTELRQQMIEQEREIKHIYLRDAEKMRREFDAVIEKKNQANDNTRDVYERRIAFTVEQAKSDVKDVKLQLEKMKLEEFQHLEEILRLKVELEERDQRNKELKNELENQSKEIVRRDETILQLRNDSHSHSIQVDDKMKRVEAELDDLKRSNLMKDNELEVLKDQIALERKEANENDERYKKRIQSLETQLRELIDAEKKSSSAHKRTIDELKASARKKVTTMESNVSQLMEENAKLKTQIKSMNEQMIQLKAQQTDFEQQVSVKKQVEMNELNIKLANQEAEKREFRDQLMNLSQKKKEEEAKVKLFEVEIVKNKMELEKLTKENSTILLELKKRKVELNNKDSELFTYQSKLSFCEETAKQYKSKINELMEENRNLSLRLDASKVSSVMFTDDVSHITNSTVNSSVAIDESVGNQSSSSVENQHSIDGDQQVRPTKKKAPTKARSTKTTAAGAVKKTRTKKTRPSPSTMELIKSVCKKPKPVDDDVPEDELMHTFSARKDMKAYSVKKRLPMSTTKAQDPSPIFSPSEVLTNLQANEGNVTRPYNTRRARVKKHLF